jgi:hemerythrin-like domain-containing protein
MSQILSNLVREHDRISSVLGALQGFAAVHARLHPEPRKVLGYFALFFREYLDGWHHGKEEALLFPALVDAGLPAHAGPVGCMLHEHDTGRALVTGLAALSQGSESLTPSEVTLLGEIAVNYARLLSTHIAKENQMLYPMALRMLRPEQWTSLDALAAEEDARRGQQGADLEELGATLVASFGGEAVLSPR